MSLLTINYELLLWYYVYYAGGDLDYSSVYWTSVFCLSVQGTRHFSRGQAVRLVTSDPAHCHGWGGAYLSAVAHLIPPPCSEHSALRLATGLSGCFSANLWHQVLNWNFFGPWEGGREAGHQHRPARTVWPAGGRSSSQPTCLYYTVLTKSLCLTIPFLYSNGETLSVYVFDNCTNAPLWKRNETLTYLE